MPRGRRILAAVLIGAGAIAYGLSPIDVIPELLTGPIGLLDDAGVLIGAAYGIWRLLSGGRGAPGRPGGPAAPGGPAPRP
ncbi:DUF1232 domain-containing protein [Homoserinibacter sp. YIM 151385]|uniref:DUF1232 domain-containing protein n=1 Tax=Homoserinibacter sp. YIM 151385 TaxID=2985506 RepID=UPI0022F01919|nr:DUF1232 domain-containing protein [Homoserinibacter sp. YIM 151385]WBU38076.1 DUF1232 domain-containing protein [Homoserinibacter sp. YIM 151385]